MNVDRKLVAALTKHSVYLAIDDDLESFYHERQLWATYEMPSLFEPYKISTNNKIGC